MALNPPDIKCELVQNDTCTSLSFEDTTGLYNEITNPNGWGLPGGPSIVDIKAITLTLVNESNDAVMFYSFKCVAGSVTECTLKINGGVVNNIFAQLPSTTLPYDSFNPFDLFADYGVDVPALEDGVYRLWFNVSGDYDNGSGILQDWDYTVQDSVTVDCNVCCCIGKLFLNLDPDCGCNDKAYYKAVRGFAYMMAAKYNTEANGNIERATAALALAQEICDGDCGCS